ncbi:hypothetical protein ACIQU5_36020 [Streptomyces sp. NPDC090306]|uniref:hypothetical protein n=1 Tax=Streptomyces sp. NPDC090306 TaxID=3365961 RepID=UPI0037FF6EF9
MFGVHRACGFDAYVDYADLVLRGIVVEQAGVLDVRQARPEQVMSRFFTAPSTVREQVGPAGEGYVQRGLGSAQLTRDEVGNQRMRPGAVDAQPLRFRDPDLVRSDSTVSLSL